MSPSRLNLPRPFLATGGVLAAAALALLGASAPAAAGPLEPSEPPDPGYTWSNVEIAGGGYVPGIVYNPTQEGLVYARTDIGGAYRLDRVADRWVPLLDHVGWDDWGHSGVLSLATDPVEPHRVYVAVGSYTNDWDPGNGAIKRSIDYGATWQTTELPFKIGGNMPGRGIGERLQIDPHHNATLYYGAEEGAGLWRSTDHGATWSRVESFPNAGNFVPDPTSDNSYLRSNLGVLWSAFDTSSSPAGEATQRIFVAVADTENVLYVSEDAGATWQPVPGAPTGFLPHKGVIDSDGGYLYLATADTAGPYDGADGEVWRHDIAEGTWTDITPGYRPVDVDFGFSGLSLDRSDPATLVVASQIQWWPDILLFRSTDRGETWSPIWEYGWDADAEDVVYVGRYEQSIDGVPWLTFGSEPVEPGLWTEPAPKLGWMVSSFEIDPHDPDEAMYGTGATIYRTQNLTDWDSGGTVELVTAAFGIEETAVQDLVAPPGEVDLLSAMLDLGGFVHTDISVVPQSFREPYFGEATSVDVAGLAPEVFVRAGRGDDGAHLVGISRDAGETWTPSSPLPDAWSSGTVALIADGSAIIWSAPGAGVHRSVDDGQTWVPVAGEVPDGARVAGDRADADLVYAIGEGSFHRSTDGGESFTTVDVDGLPDEGQIRLAAVPGQAGDVWVAGGSEEGGPYGMWRSTDGGLGFAAVEGLDEADSVGFGAAAPGWDYPAIYIAARVEGVRGVYRSIDEGATWQRINDDDHQWAWIGAAITGDPEVFGRVYLATNGRGIVVGDTGVLPDPPDDGATASPTPTDDSAATATPTPEETDTRSAEPTGTDDATGGDEEAATGPDAGRMPDTGSTPWAAAGAGIVLLSTGGMAVLWRRRALG